MLTSQVLAYAVTDLPATEGVLLLVGAALLLFGRKLYWLALGGLGFFLGLLLAQHFLDLESAAFEVAIALLLGVLGVVLAFLAQKVAIAVGGFVIGGYGAFWLTQPWHADLGMWRWLPVIVAAILGVAFAAALFEAALVVFSSLVGGLLVSGSLPLDERREKWVFLVLFAIGVMVQSRRRRPLKPEK